MALIPTVTKKAVSTSMTGMWNITLNLTCMDGAVEVINRDFSIVYKTGQDPEVEIRKIKVEMQKTINNYKAEQVLFNHAKLITAVSWLNSNLVG